MADLSDVKFTEFDYWSSDPHLQMLKAALPFMEVSQQRAFSLLVRIQELRHTMALYGQAQDPDLEICALEKAPSSPADMLLAVRPFAPAREQDFIDVIINFIQGFQIRRNYQEMQESVSAQAGNGPSPSPAPFPFEQLKGLLSPQQQSQLENIQLVLQAMQLM